MRPLVWLPLSFCIFLLPALFAQSSGRVYGKMARPASSQVIVPSGVAEGMLLEKATPVYPPIAKAARVSGTVVLEAAISKTGTIEGLHVISGPPMLQQAAYDAVKTWRYRPYMLQGEAVKVLTTINVIFSLSGIDTPLKAASTDATSPAAEVQGNTPATSSFGSFHSGMSEFAAWEIANKDGSLEIFKEFYRRYPNSEKLKVTTGTLRARYWFKMDQPFGDDGKHRDGVVVTVEGMDVGVNLSLVEAKKLNVIGLTPAAGKEDSDTAGKTFNRIYFESTGGGVLVGDQIISPKDSLNAALVLSADGSRLLSWDLSQATVAEHPSPEPTVVANADGKFVCGSACP
jgi:TonB family protein